MKKGKKKYSNEFKEQVLGCYLTCLNYHEVARIMGISVNGVKNIVQNIKNNNPKKYAQISTKIIKGTDEILNDFILRLMDYYVSSVDVSNSSQLLTLMSRQDSLFYKRKRDLYEAKTWALTYECKRLEKAILLRDSKELLKLIKESKHDSNLYEPLDYNFLAMGTRYSIGDFYEETYKTISREDKLKYNYQIKEFLIDRGYKLDTGENKKRYAKY